MFTHPCHVIIFLYSVVIFSESIYCNNHSNSAQFESNEILPSFDTLIKEHVNIVFPDKDDCKCGSFSHGCHNENGRKICHCEVWYSQDGDVCRYCYCGVLSSKCVFKDGKQKCTCFPGYSQTSYDKCESCDCGVGSEKCEYVGYSKKCTCSDGFMEKGGSCELCDCGVMSLSCTFDYWGNRKCECAKGFFPRKPSSWSDDERCTSKGSLDISGWRIATFVVSGIMVLTIIIMLLSIFDKKRTF